MVCRQTIVILGEILDIRYTWDEDENLALRCYERDMNDCVRSIAFNISRWSNHRPTTISNHKKYNKIKKNLLS